MRLRLKCEKVCSVFLAVFEGSSFVFEFLLCHNALDGGVLNGP